MGISSINNTASLFSSVGGKDKTAQSQGGFAELLNTASSASSSAKSASSQPTSLNKSSGDDAQKEFLDYMKETPAQRWQEAWLKAHGMTQAQFDALPPEKKTALIDEMKQEMQDQMRQAAEKSKDGKALAPAIGML